MPSCLDPINLKRSVASGKEPVQHQIEAIDALNDYYITDEPKTEQNGILVMPTGSGKTFTQPAVEPQEPTVSKKLKKHKYCRNCGNKLPMDANFCDDCGSKMDYE